MNCFSGLRVRLSPLAGGRRCLSVALLAVLAACGLEPSESADGPVEREYDVHFTVTADPENASVEVAMQLRQPRDLVREMSFSSISPALSDFSGDGELLQQGDRLRWMPPDTGGTLTWRARVAHQRQRNGYDAWLGPDWGVFRAEDIIPRARTRALKGSESDTTLEFVLPADWSAITEYPASSDPIRVRRPDRRFDQPTGWIVVGDLGVRRERIAGIRVAIAAPQGESVRRMDMLALLNWTLPELAALLPDPPPRLTVVSAGDPMWQGGLSAPASLFIHADEALISENSTSVLIHEVLHAALSIRSAPDMDWIVEGLAEYYGLELLRRGGAITARRYESALAALSTWATEAEFLCGTDSTGATTAKAVTVLSALDRELKDRATGDVNLDDLLRRLLSLQQPVDLETLARLAEELMGQASDALHIDKLPGCHRMTAEDPFEQS